MKKLINLMPEQINYFEKIMEIHNKINNISDESELHKILFKSRVLHGSILHKKNNEHKNEMTSTDYYNISIYESLNDLVKNTIGDIEIKLQKINNDSDIPLLTDIDNSPFGDMNNRPFGDMNNRPFGDMNKWFVLFHAPWCGHCVNFIPIWNKFESQVKIDNLKIAKINIENEKYKNIINKYKDYIKGYPTVLYIDKLKIKEYDGERTVNSLIEFINNI
jgi:thiol-disulfide isomerase/thioredoxin